MFEDKPGEGSAGRGLPELSQEDLTELAISEDAGFIGSHSGMDVETSPDSDCSTVRLYPSSSGSDQSYENSPFLSPPASGGKKDFSVGSPGSFWDSGGVNVKSGLQTPPIAADNDSRNAASRVRDIKLKKGCFVPVLRLTDADVNRLKNYVKLGVAAEKNRKYQEMKTEPLQPEEIWRCAQDRRHEKGKLPPKGKPRNFAFHYQQLLVPSKASSSSSSVVDVRSRAGKPKNSTTTGNQGSSVSTQGPGTSSHRGSSAKGHRPSKIYVSRASRRKTSYEDSDSDFEVLPPSRKRLQKPKRALSPHPSDDGIDYSSDDSMFIRLPPRRKRKDKTKPQSSANLEFRAGPPLTAGEIAEQIPFAVERTNLNNGCPEAEKKFAVSVGNNLQQQLDGPPLLADFNNIAMLGSTGANELDSTQTQALFQDENGSLAWMGELLKCDFFNKCLDDARALSYCPDVRYLDENNPRDPEQILADLDAVPDSSTSAVFQNEPVEVASQLDMPASPDTIDTPEMDIDADILVINIGDDERLY